MKKPAALNRATASPQDGLKGAQLSAGRTQARVAALTAEIVEVRRTVAEEEDRLGSHQAEGKDTAEALERLKRAQDQVTALEAGIVTAKRKDAQAQEALVQADRLFQHEVLRLKVEELHRIAVRIDHTITDTLAEDVSRWLSVASEVQRFSIPELDNKLASARALFKLKLLDGSGMPSCRTGMQPFIGDAKWSAAQPTLEDVDRLLAAR